MNRDLAENIIDATKRIDEILDELDAIARAIDDESERTKILRGIAATIMVVYNELTREVALEYPDLHPDFPNSGWPGDPRKASKT